MVETYGRNEAKGLEESVFFEFWIAISHYNYYDIKYLETFLTTIIFILKVPLKISSWCRVNLQRWLKALRSYVWS